MSAELPLLAVDVTRWLYTDAVRIKDTLDLIASLGERMNAIGIPVDRISTGIPVLHPIVRAQSALWSTDGARELRQFLQTDENHQAYANSPLKAVFEHGAIVHKRITPGREDGEFGIIADLRAEGYRDYVAMPMPFSDGTFKSIAYATRHEEGFSADQISALRSLARPLGIVCELSTLRRTAQTLLDTYVGPRASSRVLNGTIKRGDGEWISAVVCFADLRGYSRLSNQLSADQLITMLNTYFSIMAAAVERQGGEILKFIGDEVMAIYPYGGETSAQEAASRALTAARDAVHRMEVINETGEDDIPRIRVGIALHAGDVFFGNVGSETRLDFTVVGSVVNLSARIAGLAKDLNTEILVSETIADILKSRTGFYGAFPVKGFDEPIAVFSPSPTAINMASWCVDNTASFSAEAN